MRTGKEFVSLEGRAKITAGNKAWHDSHDCKIIHSYRVGHGHTVGGPSPTYRSWMAMKHRVDNPRQDNYHWYGGRGITYTSSWSLFENFLSDMGTRPEGTWLERIDNELGYSPDNCRWATPKEQANNRRAR